MRTTRAKGEGYKRNFGFFPYIIPKNHSVGATIGRPRTGNARPYKAKRERAEKCGTLSLCLAVLQLLLVVLQGIEMMVAALQVQQFLMGALLQDLALGQ